jgi:hypothetical protein
MRKTRRLLFLIVLACAIPTTSQAQWALHYVKHDWRVAIGGGSYGLTEEFSSFFSPTVGTTTTTIYLGGITWQTSLPAVWVVGLPLLGMVGVGVGWDLFRRIRKR